MAANCGWEPHGPWREAEEHRDEIKRESRDIPKEVLGSVSFHGNKGTVDDMFTEADGGEGSPSLKKGGNAP